MLLFLTRDLQENTTLHSGSQMLLNIYTTSEFNRNYDNIV